MTDTDEDNERKRAGVTVPGLYEPGSPVTTELAAVGATAAEVDRLPAVLAVLARHMTLAAISPDPTHD